MVRYVFCWEFFEVFKTIHFWERYGIRKERSDVGIFTDTFMADILDYKMAAIYSAKYRIYADLTLKGAETP